jgi:FkbM family methyltransferase
MLGLDYFTINHEAIKFCNSFLNSKNKRFVFGCNEWAKSIANQIELDGFVDDYYPQNIFFDKPVIKSIDLPKESMVVSAVVLGRPMTALKVIKDSLVGTGSFLDYYAFKKYSNLNLKDVEYISKFDEEYNNYKAYYQWLYENLSDDVSRDIMRKLFNFRVSQDLKYMKGFEDIQSRQYFEPFLDLSLYDETFIDVGSYDGYTTQEFIKRCPGYKAVHVFEPEPENMKNVITRLNFERDIIYHTCGVSNESATLNFTTSGSASKVTHLGDTTIKVERIDDILKDLYTFLKMDIEGVELQALQGASVTIRDFHPKLAICAYHRVDDLRKISELILSIRPDYRIYIRHYTEGVIETVLFFVPK